MTPGRPTLIAKRSLTVAGHRTSISLETAFWQGLRAIAERRALSVAALVAQIDQGRGPANLSSAIRVFVLEHLHWPEQSGAFNADEPRNGAP